MPGPKETPQALPKTEAPKPAVESSAVVAEPKIVANNTAVQLASSVGTETANLARAALEVVRKKGNVIDSLREQGRAMREGAQNQKKGDETQTAMGYDIEIGAVEAGIMQMQELVENARGTVHAAEYAKRLKSLFAERDTLKKERDKIQLPNQLESFARALGANDVIGIYNQLANAVSSNENRAKFIAKIRAGQAMPENVIGQLENMLNIYARTEKIEQGTKIVKTAGIITILFLLLQAYMASKSGGQGQPMH